MLTTGGGAPRAIPVSTAVQAGPRRVAARRSAGHRQTLARLRSEPRCALTIMAGRGRRVHGPRARAIVLESLPGAEGVAAVALEVDAIQDHMQPRFAIEAGVAWRWTDEHARAGDAADRARRSPSWRGGSLPAPRKLVSYRAPGGDTFSGEVRDGRVVGLRRRLDGARIAWPPAIARPRPAPTTRSTRSSCSRPTSRARSSASA